MTPRPDLPEGLDLPDRPELPDAQERARLNAAMAATGAESGFWDDQGRPAPWPDNIEDWTPDTHRRDPDEQADF